MNSDKPNKSEMFRECLKGRVCMGFKPIPLYNPYDDSVTVYFSDERCYAEDINPQVRVYRSMATQQIVGVKILGVEDVKKQCDKPIECEHEWVDARNEVVLGGMICLKCNMIKAGNN